jgi:hypothetical protein
VPSRAFAPMSTDPEQAPLTRLTWAHAAPVSRPSFAGVPSSGGSHEPWIRAPLLPRVTPVLRALALAGLIGVIAGVATSYVESVAGAPAWSHSFAPWAMVTTGVGFMLRGRWQVAAMAGLLTQLGLVVGFFWSQAAFEGGTVATQALVTYAVVALVAGPFFAAAAGFLRDPCVATRTLGLAIVSAPWVADGVRMMASGLGPDPRILTQVVAGASLLAIGIALPLLINGSSRDALRNLGVVAGFGLFIVVALLLFPDDGWTGTPTELHLQRIGQAADLT